LTLTFVDAGVLIAAVRGTPEIGLRANQVLGDPRRSFASSPFLRLEVLPKVRFHKKFGEVYFYETFFETERLEKPIHRVTEIRVRSLHPAE
jgi:hypothetical protein